MIGSPIVNPDLDSGIDPQIAHTVRRTPIGEINHLERLILDAEEEAVPEPLATAVRDEMQRTMRMLAFVNPRRLAQQVADDDIHGGVDGGASIHELVRRVHRRVATAEASVKVDMHGRDSHLEEETPR